MGQTFSFLRTILFLAQVVFCLAAWTLAEQRFDSNGRSRSLLWGWGHSWRYGIPGWEKTASDIAFAAFHPQMGWFFTDRLELYGEGTLLLYHQPEVEIAAGLVGIAGRYHFWNKRAWTPYLNLGGGLLWTSLEVPEIDRVFNFQILYGGGLRFTPERGSEWIFEWRNHHISNAGTAGENLGINAATLLEQSVIIVDRVGTNYNTNTQSWRLCHASRPTDHSPQLSCRNRGGADSCPLRDDQLGPGKGGQIMRQQPA